MPEINFEQLRSDLQKRQKERDAEVLGATLPDGSKFIKDPNNPRKFLKVQPQVTAETKTKNELGELLSPEESTKLGVPYGTTKGDAAGKTGVAPLTKMTEGERTSLSSSDAALVKINEIRSLVDEKGADTGGTVKVRDALQRLGIRSIFGLNKENASTTDLKAKLSELGAEYAKVLSGTAVSDKEFQNRLKPFLPQTTDTKEQIKRKLENLEKSIGTKQKAIGERAKGSSLTQGDEIDKFLNGIGQ